MKLVRAGECLEMSESELSADESWGGTSSEEDSDGGEGNKDIAAVPS